ncbi:MAG TPA: DMT family transporter, partial [Acidobacteriota bacterium]|nr:DMT family transporter [Acidobacteriota bacterium]
SYLRGKARYLGAAVIALLACVALNAFASLRALRREAEVWGGTARSIVPTGRDDRIRVAVAGLLTIFVYHLSLNAGSRTVPAGVSSLLVNTGPIFTAMAATLFLRERLGARGWGGLAIAFSGAALVSWGVAGGFRFEGDIGFLMLAAVAQAAYFAVSKPMLARRGVFETTCRTIWWGTLFLLPFAPETWRAIQEAPAAATWSVVYLGVFPGAIGYVTWTYVLSRLPASRASSLLYLVPPLAFAIAWVGLGEQPTWISALGGIPIIAGVALVNSERLAPRPAAEPRGAQGARS